MGSGETWKWALVAVLLIVFLFVGGQAYKSVFNPDNDIPPPDDWNKGDSWDDQHRGGPGMGQPVEVPKTVPTEIPEKEPSVPAITASVTHEGELDWSKVNDPSQK